MTDGILIFMLFELVLFPIFYFLLFSNTPGVLLNLGGLTFIVAVSIPSSLLFIFGYALVRRTRGVSQGK